MPRTCCGHPYLYFRRPVREGVDGRPKAGQDEAGTLKWIAWLAPIFGYRLILDGASLRAPKPLANGRPRGSLLFTFHHSPSTRYSLLATEAVLMARQSIEIAPGAFYCPGYLDRAAARGAARRCARRHRRGAALPSAHAAFRQSLFGAHDELRAARLGLGYRRLSLPGDPSRDRRALALHPGACSMVAWRDLSGFPFPPEACLVNHYADGTRLGLHQDRDEKAPPRLSSRSRSATRRSSGSAARSARMRHARSSSRAGMRSSSAVCRVSPFMASTACCPEPRRSFRSADASISPCAV